MRPMYSVRDEWIDLLKKHGPLTFEQIKRMSGVRPNGKSWIKLMEDGCIRARVVENPLTGRGRKTYINAYEYVKDPGRQRRAPTKNQIEKAKSVLLSQGWQLIPPGTERSE